MTMLTNEYRTYLTEMRALSVDSEGNEVLVGLTLEELSFI